MNSHGARLTTKDQRLHRLIKTAVFGVLAGFMIMSPSQVFANSANSVTATANLRMRTGATLDSEVIKMVPEGSQIRVINAENREWFRVEFDGVQGYMYSDFLASPNISLIAGANLRLRTSPSLDGGIIKTVPEGSVVQVRGYVNSEWHRVEFNGELGYMFSEFLLAQGETSPVADTAPIIDTPPVMNTQNAEPTQGTPIFVGANLRLREEPSTSAEIIKTVRQGSTVYIIDDMNDEWKRVAFNGVQGYMFADYLFERSTASTPAVSPNGVELIHWSEARNIVRTGVPIQITDVRTGITYWVSSFSNGNHADVETLTPEDTATMLYAFGGQWTWTPRPVWVHIDGRTIAASINGMPHAGSTISGNNMNGHVCLHFYGSRTHNGTVSHERQHQAAVQEAFNASR